ncbi:TPA: hypothetical protein SE795_001892, partial [Campylobacter jejuni]|nr:hypothetical protein [Campylobacter jejuni]
KTFYEKVDLLNNWKGKIASYGITKERQISRLEWLELFISTNQDIFFLGWDVLIDFCFLKNIKLQFINGILFEDVAFGTCLFIYSKRVHILPLKLYKYRIRENSIMQSLNSKDSIPYYLQHLQKYFNNVKDLRLYHKIFSRINNVYAITNVINLEKDEKIGQLMKEAFFPFLEQWSFGILEVNKDPLKCLHKIPICSYNEKIKFIINATKDEIIFNWVSRLYNKQQNKTIYLMSCNYLSYKLGRALEYILKQNIFLILFLPFILISIVIMHNREREDANFSLKTCKLNYDKIIEIKNTFYYQLGQVLIVNLKTWYRG